MRIPLSWLREHAPLPEGATSEYLLETLVKVGFEEEDIHRPADEIHGPVVVGQVLTREPEQHSNGKTINWCTVRVVPEGQSQPLTGKGIEPSGVQGIVCGAANFEVGDKVCVTLPGAELPGGFQISVRKTYGHVSAGMMASAKELGLGDDHSGIIVFSDLGLDPELGTDALPLLGLDDEAAEINVTPDRGYALSLRGVAREYCHAVEAEFTDPAEQLARRAPAENGEGFVVGFRDEAPIHGQQGVTRFVARTVRDVDLSRPTPPWMASRLRLAGIRSISLPVDVSNYVMLELGQPLHFYDAEKIEGPIVVRRARSGETLETLDGKTRTLDPEDLVVSDSEGAIGLAGVMGGARTEVTAATRHILVEAAHFEEVSVARTRRRHKLPSEASKRFERGVDPLVAPAAAQRAVELLVELAGATADEGVTEHDLGYQPHQISMPVDYPSRRVGLDYTEEQLLSVLTEIGAQAVRTGDQLQVTPPSWRPDLQAKEDLTEEIARLVGYEQIPARIPSPSAGRGYSVEQAVRRQVSTALAAAGLVEVVSYPFVTREENQLFGAAEASAELPMVSLVNPISAAYGYLQRSLLPGLLQVLRRNHARGFRDLALFDTAHVFIPHGHHGTSSIPAVAAKPSQEVLADLEDGLPRQPRHYAAVFTGQQGQPGPGAFRRPLDWRDALDAAQAVARVAGVPVTVRQGRHQAFHPGRTAELVLTDGTSLGHAGELHPQVLKDLELPERVCAMEVDFDRLAAQAGAPVAAAPISGFPATDQDVALVVDQQLPAAELVQTLREGAGDLLEEARVFDLYQGPGIEEGKKSLAFSLRFRSPERTLTNDEASAFREAAVQLAEQRHGATLRG